MSSIDAAKAAMHFIPAKERPACVNCANAEARDCIHPTWWCELGNFLTSPLAICDHYARRDGRPLPMEPLPANPRQLVGA